MEFEPDITVVMPVHNETEMILKVGDGLMKLIGERILELIVIVTPTSPPETMAFIKQLKQKYSCVKIEIQKVMPGIGNAYRQAYAIAKGKYVLNMESDGEMDVNTVPLMVHLMDEGHDLVQASRWAQGGGFVGYSRLRYILNWGFQKLFRALFATHISDLTYGFKIMLKEYAQGFKWEGVMHEFSCESTLRPIKAGARVAQVPTIWRARTKGKSAGTFWRNFRYGAMAIRILIQGARGKEERR